MYSNLENKNLGLYLYAIIGLADWLSYCQSLPNGYLSCLK